MNPLWIDLRSDTVTQPSAEMRRAMAAAEVDDDVYGEDPTINRLEARAAEIFAREAAIFVPSGTMGNQIAIKLHTRPGQEVLCEERGHIFNYEMAMPAWFSGCLVRPVSALQGILSWELLAPRIAPPTYYVAPTGLIALENTHNMAGGTVTPVAAMEEICARAHRAQPSRASGWRAHLQRRNLSRQAGCRDHPRFRFGYVLPIQGIGRAGRLHAHRQQGIHPAGALRAQGAGRRHASGRHPGRRRSHRTGTRPSPPARRPRQRPPACRRRRRHSRHPDRPGRRCRPTSSSSMSAAPASPPPKLLPLSNPRACLPARSIPS